MRPTQQLLKKYRHLRLTTKDINKGYYKGNRTGTIGTHTKHGGFIVDYSRVRTYVVPQGLKDFKLTPFVTLNVDKTYGQYETKAGPRDPAVYLNRWKRENAVD